MAERIRIENLSDAISDTLTIYSKNVEEAIEKVTKSSMKDLVAKTKATAPVGHRGSFKSSITSKKLPTQRGSLYVWYVKAPDHRLTHLLVHGHAKKNGGRTKSNPFLKNALDAVLPSYEEKIKEVVSNGASK